jgi:hypothetical protein
MIYWKELLTISYEDTVWKGDVGAIINMIIENWTEKYPSTG